MAGCIDDRDAGKRPCLQQNSHNASSMHLQCSSCNSRFSAKCLHCKPAAPSPDCFSPPFQLFSTIKDGHNFKLFSKGRKPSLYGLHTKGQSISLFGLWCKKKIAVCNGLIVQESKDKYLEQDLCLLAIKTSFVDYKRNKPNKSVFFSHNTLTN